MDDEALVRRCLHGEVEAYAGLVERYERPLFNVALRVLRDREEARDATQSAFVKGWQALPAFDVRRRFFSWLYRILMNEALNRLERRRRLEPLDEDLVAGERSPEESAERSQRSAAVHVAIDRLSAEQREVIVLRHWLEMSYEEMADVLAIPEKTVKSRLFSARQRLGEILRREGVQGS